MIYNTDINTKSIISNLYSYNNFTLTVNTVNDAPVLLQSLKSLDTLEDSGTAAEGAKYLIPGYFSSNS